MPTGRAIAANDPQTSSFMGSTSSAERHANERASNLALILSQAFMKLQMELMREGMTVEMGSNDPDGKNRLRAFAPANSTYIELNKHPLRVLLLITASMRQLMEEAELLQLAIRVKQVCHTPHVL